MQVVRDRKAGTRRYAPVRCGESLEMPAEAAGEAGVVSASRQSRAARWRRRARLEVHERLAKGKGWPCCYGAAAAAVPPRRLGFCPSFCYFSLRPARPPSLIREHSHARSRALAEHYL